MAASSETVQLIFQGVDQTSAAITGISGRIGTFSNSLQSVTGPLASVTSTILGLETAIAGIAIAMGTQAFNASVKLEASTLDLKKVFDDTEGDLSTFIAGLNDLATTYGVASGELIQSAANFKQAGFTAQEASQLVKNSLDLVIAGDLEAAQASDLLVASLKGFNAPANEAAGIIDLLNQVSNKYATNVQELIIGFSQLSPVAGQVNLSFKETAAILTPAIEVYRSGSEAARAFRTVLLRLADPTPKIQAAFDQLGVSTTDLEGKQRSARDILFDVADAFQDVEQNAKAQLSAIIAGKDQAGKFAAVMDNFNKVLEISSDEFQFLGSAAAEVEIRLASAEKQIDIAAVKFNQLSTAIGNQYRVEVVGAIQATGNLAASARDLVNNGGLAPFFELLRPLIKEFEVTIQAVADNLPAAFDGLDFDRLINSLKSVGIELGSVFDVDLRSADGLRDALQTLIDGLAFLNEFTAGALSQLGPFVQGLGEIADSVVQAGPEVATLAGNIGGFATALNTVLPVIGTLAGVMATVFGVKGLFSAGAVAVGGMATAATTLPSILGASAATLGTLGTAAGAAAGAAGVGLLSFELGKMGNEALGISDKIVDFVARITGLDDSVDDLLKPVSAASLGIKEFGENVGDASKKAAETDTTLKQGKSALIDWSKEIGNMADNTADAGDELNNAEKEMAGIVDTAEKLTGVTHEQAQAWRDQADAAAAAREIVDGVNLTFEYGIFKFSQASKAIGKVGETLDDMAQKGEISKDKFAELTTELEKARIEAKVKLDISELETNADIAIQELKTFENVTTAFIELDIERLKADAERAVAIVNNIGDGFQASGQVITSALEGIAGITEGESLGDKFLNSTKLDLFRSQLESENERFDKLIDNQTRLVDAQVARMQAETGRLQRGDALISIQGDGLEPELEAFMFRILERIQIKANADSQAFLLGFAS